MKRTAEEIPGTGGVYSYGGTHTWVPGSPDIHYDAWPESPNVIEKDYMAFMRTYIGSNLLALQQLEEYSRHMVAFMEAPLAPEVRFMREHVTEGAWNDIMAGLQKHKNNLREQINIVRL